MAFFSRDDYLAAEARKSQMRLKGLTPPTRPGVKHPPEHERQRMQSLLNSIPETQPGPNAFAIQAPMKERRRIEDMHESDERREGDEQRVIDVRDYLGDYRKEDAQGSLKSRLDQVPSFQQELQRRRRVTPPTSLHPTMRGRSLSEASIAARQSIAFADITRQSDCTNIQQFMDAGLQASPALKLNATPNPGTVPTFRDRLEKQDMPAKHARSGSVEESVPVFRPTPKLPAARDFAQRPSTPADGVQTEMSGSKLPVKTPKKSIFSKFKLSTNSRTANPTAANEAPADPASLAEEHVSVKAQAVLGESPRQSKGRFSLGASPTKIPRSPSKRKNFFSRKNVDFIEPPRPPTALSEHQRPPNTQSTGISDGPQTAISDPTHYSYQEKRSHSRRQSKDVSKDKKEAQKNAMVVRSQSVNLRYLDGSIPPTPPAKNTPPHEKAAKEAKEVEEMHEAMKLPPFQRQRAPEDANEGIVSNTRKITDPRLGNYGYRDAPTLVTKPSMYSVHASVVPDLMEASTIEEMNARVGALDLEGFSTPAESIRRSNIAAAVYSPSIYSPEWAANDRFTNPGATPMLQVEESRVSNTPSAHTKDSSSNGTIPIFYPELATDPSIGNKAGKKISKRASDSPVKRGRAHLSPELTYHRWTHSRDPLDNESQMFADQADTHDYRQSMYNSPSTFSHTSAMPSPLQYLPATTYTPAPKKSTKKAMQSEADISQYTPSEKKSLQPNRGSGLGIQNDEASTSHSPDRQPGIFDTKLSLLAAGRDDSTQHQASGPSTYEDSVNVDPQKQPAPLRDIPADKLDVMMGMLSKLHARNGELVDMRDEMRASTARLDQRLSAVESQNRPSPPLTPSTLGYGGSDNLARSQANRIPTDVAHEFYRSAQGGAMQQGTGTGTGEVVSGAESEGGAVAEESENETIRELREMNKKLLKMVGGFANKIQALEEKMKRGSG